MCKVAHTHTHRERHLNIHSHSLTCCRSVYVCVRFLNAAHTINIQAGRMLHTTRTILSDAGILAAILDHDMAYVNMTNYISVHRDVLSDHKSVKRRGRISREEKKQKRKTDEKPALIWQTFVWHTRRMRNALCIFRIVFCIFKPDRARDINEQLYAT